MCATLAHDNALNGFFHYRFVFTADIFDDEMEEVQDDSKENVTCREDDAESECKNSAVRICIIRGASGQTLDSVTSGGTSWSNTGQCN